MYRVFFHQSLSIQLSIQCHYVPAHPNLVAYYFYRFTACHRFSWELSRHSVGTIKIFNLPDSCQHCDTIVNHYLQMYSFLTFLSRIATSISRALEADFPNINTPKEIKNRNKSGLVVLVFYCRYIVVLTLDGKLM